MSPLVSKLESCLTSGKLGWWYGVICIDRLRVFFIKIIFSFVTKYEDTKVIRGCKVVTALLITPLLVDYFWVKSFLCVCVMICKNVVFPWVRTSPDQRLTCNLFWGPRSDQATYQRPTKSSSPHFLHYFNSSSNFSAFIQEDKKVHSEVFSNLHARTAI